MKLLNDPMEWSRVSPEERGTPEGFFRREASLWKFWGILVTFALLVVILCIISYSSGRVVTAEQIKGIVTVQVKQEMDGRMAKIEDSLANIEDQLIRQQGDLADLKRRR